jgi:hypothetical protein
VWTERLDRDEKASGKAGQRNDPGDECPGPELHRELLIMAGSSDSRSTSCADHRVLCVVVRPKRFRGFVAGDAVPVADGVHPGSAPLALEVGEAVPLSAAQDVADHALLPADYAA